MDKENYFELMDGDVRVWIEQEAIHIKAAERSSGDPVELTAAMARNLAEELQNWANELED